MHSWSENIAFHFLKNPFYLQYVNCPQALKNQKTIKSHFIINIIIYTSIFCAAYPT